MLIPLGLAVSSASALQVISAAHGPDLAYAGAGLFLIALMPALPSLFFAFWISFRAIKPDAWWIRALLFLGGAAAGGSALGLLLFALPDFLGLMGAFVVLNAAVVPVLAAAHYLRRHGPGLAKWLSAHYKVLKARDAAGYEASIARERAAPDAQQKVAKDADASRR